MTPKEALTELLYRVASLRDAPTLFNVDELSRWPQEAVAALKAQKLIIKARPASSAICPGCEEECVMPVQTIPVADREPALFVVCDKRNDINRVDISPDKLEQWQTSIVAVGKFIADGLSLQFSGKPQDEKSILEIGIATGSKRSQMLCLLVDDKLSLVTGSNSMPLAETIYFRDGRYTLDADLIRQRVDASKTGDSRYTPSTARREMGKLETSAMREQWRKAYRQLRAHRPKMSDVWYSKQIAKMGIAQGRSSETIRKQMKN